MAGSTQITAQQRLLSLDFFRGVTVMAMIIVNSPGNGFHVYGFLEHSQWNGCTPADLVFPFFLFIVGVSIPYSVDKRRSIMPHKSIILRAARRSMILIALGLLLSLFPAFDFAQVRIPGILPRIGVVYFFCVLLYLRSSIGTQAWIFGFLLLAYYFLMVLVPVPGVGYASTEPGINLAAWIDRRVFTDAHLYKPYSPYNPAELLTTMTAIASGISGVITGWWLKRGARTDRARTGMIIATGVLLILAGMAWGVFFPVNKLLWTSSFVLYSGGWAMITLAVSYWLIDVRGYKGFTKPFVVFGANAITAYCLSVLIKRIARMIEIPFRGHHSNSWDYVYHVFFEPFFNPYNASFLFTIAILMGWMVVLWWMYNKRIIVKI